MWNQYIFSFNNVKLLSANITLRCSKACAQPTCSMSNKLDANDMIKQTFPGPWGMWNGRILSTHMLFFLAIDGYALRIRFTHGFALVLRKSERFESFFARCNRKLCAIWAHCWNQNSSSTLHNFCPHSLDLSALALHCMRQILIDQDWARWSMGCWSYNRSDHLSKAIKNEINRSIRKVEKHTFQQQASRECSHGRI